MGPFEGLLAVIGGEDELRELDRVYARMPSYDFCSDFIARAFLAVGVMQLRDVAWSDWGSPRRIAATLAGIGRQPNFPTQYLRAS